MLWVFGNYRYFETEFDEKELDQILGYFAVKYIIVGHTSQKQVLSMYENKVIAIDSSIKLGESGELLIVKSNKFIRGLYDGSQVSLFD